MEAYQGEPNAHSNFSLQISCDCHRLYNLDSGLFRAETPVASIQVLSREKTGMTLVYGFVCFIQLLGKSRSCLSSVRSAAAGEPA